jgi:hypothetical protein
MCRASSTPASQSSWRPRSPIWALTDAGLPLSIPFIKNGGYSGDDPNAGYWKAFFDDPVLRLPAGRWRLSANFQGMTSDRCEGAMHRLQAAVTFDVVR